MSILIIFAFLVVVGIFGDVSATGPPTLPPGYSSWVVRSLSLIYPNNTIMEQWSIGEHIDIDTSFNGFCTYGRQQLFPVSPPDRQPLFMYNYSTGYRFSKVILNNGGSVDCSVARIPQGTMPPGGDQDYAPSTDVLSKMVFIGYASVDNANCSQWKASLTPDANTLTTLIWSVRVIDSMPALLTNNTYNAVANLTYQTTIAYVGQYVHQGFNANCSNADVCLGSVCIANRQSSPDQLGGALSWVCGGNIDCAPINAGGKDFYPNTLLTHCDWAFNTYYEAHSSQGPGACAFGGTANLVQCDTTCKTCQPLSNATDAQMLGALNWVCGTQGIQDCSAIAPGGDHFFPNTTRDHANWAFTKYFDVYRCVPGMDACSFGGIATVVPCT
eukprot:PhF_6_TR30429/c0_g1_i1/m.44662